MCGCRRSGLLTCPGLQTNADGNNETLPREYQLEVLADMAKGRENEEAVIIAKNLQEAQPPSPISPERQ